MPENDIVKFLARMEKQLEEINHNLDKQEEPPKIFFVKDLQKAYGIAPETARQICKKYGTNVGGLGIEKGRLLWVLQNEGMDILKGV